MNCRNALALSFLFSLAGQHQGNAAEPGIGFQETPGRLEITLSGQPIATYVYQDAETWRPYFANVQTPGQIRVTRQHPVDPDRDGGDHGTMHPGIWLAFGDINGGDFWRNRARVLHRGFAEKPHVEQGRGTFSVRNAYEHDGQLVCSETCRYTIIPRNDGYLLMSDSRFSNDAAPFAFGDQEELGFGVRVNRELRVKGGNGRILNADGRVNEKQVWGQATDWCDYSGTIDGRFVGLTVMPHPVNFRRSWFHVRDYGLMLANPFGRHALTGGEKSSVEVKPGDTLRLRFGVFIHDDATADQYDPAAVYRDYAKES